MRLEKVAEDYFAQRVSREDAEKMLMLILYTDRERWGLEDLTDENFGDFLCDYIESITKSLDSFKPECGSFENYFYVYVRTSYYTWRKRRARKETLEESLMFCSSLEFDDYAERYERDEYASRIDRIPDMESAFIDFMNGKNIGRGKCGGKFFRESLLILAVKSAMFIDEDMIQRVCQLTGVSPSKLDDMLKTARESIVKRRERVRQEEACREKAWFNHCRYRMEREKLSKDTFWWNEVNRKYDFFTRKWTNHTKKNYRRRGRLSPSNRTVGEILGLDLRHVGYVIKHLETQMDRFNTKCYSQNHENLSCNGQSEQKAGNE